ncbi:Flowering time control protein FCA [Citrus sinensis]|uniref:Flowering time control protein FCA n=1 Tax=Citrus sinensis TaxID=2711 RepID=A0ACB8IA69_CITSI|nr:Flowering time control protein FCA [Citrus sinensis]
MGRSAKLERQRGDRYYGPNSNYSSSFNNNQDSHYNNNRHNRPSRFTDGPLTNRYNNNNNSGNSSYQDSFQFNRCRSPNDFHVDGGGAVGGADGGHRPFDSPPRRAPGGVGGGFRPMGGGFRPMSGPRSGMNYPLPQSLPVPQLSGQKRGFSGRGGPSPDLVDGSSFAKLFVGSVPKTAREEDIRPLFEEHGNVIEVALIKDKKTGQQQGYGFEVNCGLDMDDNWILADFICFNVQLKHVSVLRGSRVVLFSSVEMNAQVHIASKSICGGKYQACDYLWFFVLPGVGPIQVRYADGERERLGAVEYKLFVGSLNKQATEKEVEEIFSPYGRVEDVYLMRDELKQSRGCGFVKYSHRDMALAAINALNGIYTMRGCDQPLTVRFADPKRPRPGDSRSGPAFGGPGVGPRFQPPGPRPPPNFGDPITDQIPQNAWHPMSPRNMGPLSNPGIRGFGNQLPPRSGDLGMPLNPGGPADVPLLGLAVSSTSSALQQNFCQPESQAPSLGQQISPLQKPLQSPQHMPPLQLHPQVPSSYSHTQNSHLRQLQIPGQTSFSQALPSQHLLGMSGNLPASQPQGQQIASSSTALPTPLNIKPQSSSLPSGTNQQQLPAPVQQQLHQPYQQSPSQLAQMLSQQTQTLQATFQSSQQAFSQLQQQLQLMQPSNQNLPLQQGSHGTKQQSQWAGIAPQTVASAPASAPAADLPVSTSIGPAAPVSSQTVAPAKSSWTEHTSPDGYKYYYNCVTGVSKWEKPEELTLFEQQQQQQKPPVQQPPSQLHPQVLPAQHIPQTQQVQLQTQLRQQQQQQLQQPFSSSYQAPVVRGQHNAQELGYTQLPPVAAGSVNDPTRFQQVARVPSILSSHLLCYYHTFLLSSYTAGASGCSRLDVEEEAIRC